MAEQARAEFAGDEVRLFGPLTFDTVTKLHRGVNLFGQTRGDIVVNLEQVSRADSAALALLIDWLRQARRQNRGLHFSHLPDDLRALAVICGIERLLPQSE